MHHRYDPSIMFHQSAWVFVGPGTLTAKPPQPTPSICVAADSLSQPLNLLPACIIYTLTFLCWCLLSTCSLKLEVGQLQASRGVHFSHMSTYHQPTHRLVEWKKQRRRRPFEQLNKSFLRLIGQYTECVLFIVPLSGEKTVSSAAFSLTLQCDLLLLQFSSLWCWFLDIKDLIFSYYYFIYY